MIFRFAAPWLLLLLVVPLLLLLWRAKRGGAAFGACNLAAASLRPSRGPLAHRLLCALGLAGLIIALARPQYGREISERENLGRDIVLVLDLSFSMIADDMVAADGQRQTRLRAVFDSAAAFVAKRPDDRIGIVLFAEESTTTCPLTYDHFTVQDFLTRTRERQEALWLQSLERRHPAGLLGNGTNLGLGIGNGLKRLQEKNPRGRAVVLITDGRDTRELRNWVDPLEAARHAASQGIVIHAIGVGDPQGTMHDIDARMMGMQRLVPVTRNMLPDMSRLHDIVTLAGGISGHADNAEAVAGILESIQGLEPTPRTVRIREDYSDRFLPWLVAGLALLALALLAEPRLRGVA